MKRVQTVKMPNRLSVGKHYTLSLPRLLAQLWGTTSNADIMAAFVAMLRRGEIVEGPVINQYEQAIARLVGTRFAYSFNSGRVAFYAILRALNIGPGDEVLLQVPTHIVVTNAIRYVGARPVYVDCDLSTYNMDLEQAEKLISPRTKVLLLQHTFGIPANPKVAKALADKYGLTLIEDCVHALGAKFDGQPVGSFGRAAFFSTEETKIISSTMGGVAVTNDPDLASQLANFQESCPWPSEGLVRRYLLKLIIYHSFTHPHLHPYTRLFYMNLRRHPHTHLAPGATSVDEQQGLKPGHYEQKFSNAQALVALRQLNLVDQNLAHRRFIAGKFRENLLRLGFTVPDIPTTSEPSFVRFPVMVQDRPLAMKLAAQRVVLGQWFNTVLEESQRPSDGDYVEGSCPRAEFAAQHLVNLPTHLRVLPADVEAICSIMADIEPAKRG